jgi:small ligand-binding sensory domain FIST
MPFASALSTAPETMEALDEICSRAMEALKAIPDLALIFFSPQHTEHAQDLATQVSRRLGARCLLGCPGESIVGNDQEIENGPAMSLWLAHWNTQVQLTPFHLAVEETMEGYALLGWPDERDSADPEQSFLLLLADPFSFPVDEFLNQVNKENPGLRVMGGMASGGRQPGQNCLVLDNIVLDRGAIGVMVQGPIHARSVVSQGCRPIGRHLVITKANENIIGELGGKPALVQLQRIWDQLSPSDQELARHGLHVGRVINEYKSEFTRGDFLVRNVIGLDRNSGAISITDRIRAGQTIQFHVRDAETAGEDLRELLQADLAAHEKKPAGALLFTCNGRGTRLFQRPHHDAQTIRAMAGTIPTAGFFAMGELGPVGGQNFIHGFTASVALFED